MSISELGDVIAERTLTLEGEPSIRITVLMGAPQRFADGEHEHYECPIQIRGIGDEAIRRASGVDAFQALELGLQLIGVELYVKLNRKFGGRLRWVGQKDLGFTLPDSVLEFGPPRLQKVRYSPS